MLHKSQMSSKCRAWEPARSLSRKTYRKD